MKNSIYELYVSFGRFLIDLFYWLDWDNGISTTGLMLAMDWYYWAYWCIFAKINRRRDINVSPPSAWYWAERNADESHEARPWREKLIYNECPF